jgi:hypothetical protein
VSDKITNIGQYGYSKKKQCQEVLIGLINEIHKSKGGNQEGLLISLDIKKAFDSISHSYMSEVLKFFNFGDQFIKWVRLLCTNREACVILLGNKVGKNFKLQRGNAQGDTISPFIFNICYQLLIFKIEYDLQIERLPVDNPVPVSPLFSCQKPVSAHAKKVFTFADDCNVLCNRDQASLVSIKTILQNFSLISGLECNLEKTNIMCIGKTRDSDADITQHGFLVKDKLTILGMTVSNNFEQDLRNNANHITRKVSENVAKWGRFGLCLPGRILIAKSMLYSQINYLGCFLPFAAEDYTNWENLIHEYTVGNLKFGKKKTFQQVEIGGLGLFDIGKFLQAQKLRWVISASKNLDAGWKVTLAKCAIVNPFRFDDSTLEKVCPILTSFADTLRAFKVEFFRISNNYKKAKIFGETLMTAGLRSKSFLDIRDLDLIQHEATRNNLLKTMVGDLLSNGLPISRQQLEILWEGTIPTQVYNKIQKIIAAAKVRYNKEMPEQGITLEIFFDT